MASLNRLGTISQPEAFATLHPNLLIGIHRALSLLASRGIVSGGYYEFGLFRGFSFWYANNLAHELGLTLEFHGFDSFEGLPPSEVDIHDNWKPGSYACSLKQVALWLERWKMPCRYHLHQGWYSPDMFTAIESEYALPKPAIAVVDCDLYESAIEVLSMLRTRLCIGTILLFDDFNAFAGDEKHGERRALSEFESQNKSFKKNHLFSFGPYGEAFEVTAL